ncbi:MAG: tRNA (adenosine(37)-N6)-threonylcarbamoyltransferase complex ATPase subunit type 1 TsaE [Gammaproteobacteria bacterium]
MGQSEVIKSFRSEAELIDSAGQFARALRAAGCRPLVLGLAGTLGTGKTTWARAMLRGLDYQGRVPSPTYTLLEQYDLGDLTLVHLDLYRLSGDAELEHLGVRDWLADANAWVVFEWPERAPALAARCDLVLEFADSGDSTRQLTLRARTRAGIEALEHSYQAGVNNER